MIAQLVIHIFGGLFWTIAYVLIVLRSRKDKTYGMPLAALSANITWEFYFTVVAPPTYASSLIFHAQRTIGVIWLVLDFVILWYALRYGPREFPSLSRLSFYGIFAVIFVVVGSSDVLISKEFHDNYGIRVSFLQALMMSLLFLAMLNARQSLRGQSLGIAITKMLGTAAASLGVYLRPPAPGYDDSVLLPFLYIAIFVVDIIYVAAVHSMGSSGGAMAKPLASTVRRGGHAGTPAPAYDRGP